MNLFRYWDMIKYTTIARIIEYVTDKIIIVDFELINKLNKPYDWWQVSNLNQIHKWLSFSNTIDSPAHRSIVIPSQVIDFYDEIDSNLRRGCIIIQFKTDLIGMIMVEWSKPDNNTKSKWIYKPNSINVKNQQIVIGVIVARGLFAKSIDIKNVSFEKNDRFNYINRIDNSMIDKKDINITYKSNVKHKAGFCLNEIVSEFVGDLKELWNMGGMAGGRSKFFCCWCYITSDHNSQNPTVENRCHQPRSFEKTIKLLHESKRNNFQDTSRKYYPNRIKTKGGKHAPLCKSLPSFWSFPIIHMLGGDGGRILLAIKSLVFQNCQKNEQIEQWQKYNELLYQLESELAVLEQELHLSEQCYGDNLRDNSVTPEKDTNLFRFHTNNNSNNSSNNARVFNLSNDSVKTVNKLKKKEKINKQVNENINCGSNYDNSNESNETIDFNNDKVSEKENSNETNETNETNEKKDLDNEDVLENIDNFEWYDESDLEDININSEDEFDISENELFDINDKIENIKNQIQQCVFEISQLEMVLDPNREQNKLYQQIVKDLGIVSLSYRENELTGPNGLRLVNNYKIILPKIKDLSIQAFEIASILFPTLKFLVHSMCHKNKEPLSDEFISLHKFAVLKYDKLIRLFIKTCYSIDLNEPCNIGFKNHFNNHIHSKMEWTRITCAHSDEQIPECVCKKHKNIFRQFRNRLSKKTIKSINRRMNCHHNISFDPTNQ